jgi:hypothetical protein
MNLLSIPTLVESPFIIVKIGKYTFGSYHKINTSENKAMFSKVTYPNYMKSIEMQKINGQVNTYTIVMEYKISAGDDPNLLDKVFSSISNVGPESRKITLSYGDWNSPSFIYKEEVAIITNVTSSVDYSGSAITYTIKCISDSLPLTAVLYNFPGRRAKPSDVIKELLQNKTYKLTDVFYGMSDSSKVEDELLIASDDKVVQIPARSKINAIEYLNFLVNCMVCIDESSNSSIRKSKYTICLVDDTLDKMGGPYFKVTKVSVRELKPQELDVYDIDIGYPGDNFVTQFSLKNDQSWALLYQYSKDVSTESYIYRIDDQGNTYMESSPSIMRGLRTFDTTEIDKTWWTQMTQFPVSATLTIKGLVRPSILMSKVRLNVYFYGQKHVSSGLYVITKQVDRIDSNGYKTTLSLLRIDGDVVEDTNNNPKEVFI